MFFFLHITLFSHNGSDTTISCIGRLPRVPLFNNFINELNNEIWFQNQALKPVRLNGTARIVTYGLSDANSGGKFCAKISLE